MKLGTMGVLFLFLLLVMPAVAADITTSSVSIRESCGNSFCAGDEICSTCPSDCGACPSRGGRGGRSGGGSTAYTVHSIPVIMDFTERDYYKTDFSPVDDVSIIFENVNYSVQIRKFASSINALDVEIGNEQFTFIKDNPLFIDLNDDEIFDIKMTLKKIDYFSEFVVELLKTQPSPVEAPAAKIIETHPIVEVPSTYEPKIMVKPNPLNKTLFLGASFLSVVVGIYWLVKLIFLKLLV